MSKTKAKAKAKKKAKEAEAEIVWIDVDEAFAEMTADARLRPTTVLALACPMCAQWLEARAVHHSSSYATDSNEEAGVLFEITLFSNHSCMPPVEGS